MAFRSLRVKINCTHGTWYRPALGYDPTLTKYAEWTRTLKGHDTIRHLPQTSFHITTYHNVSFMMTKLTKKKQQRLFIIQCQETEMKTGTKRTMFGSLYLKNSLALDCTLHRERQNPQINTELHLLTKTKCI